MPARHFDLMVIPPVMPRYEGPEAVSYPANSVQNARWITVTAIDATLEVLLVVAPAILFYPVQISRSRKLSVLGAFIPRIMYVSSWAVSSIADESSVPIFFVLYLKAFLRFRGNGGSSLDVIPNMVWQQVLCGYALISATTPCLKGFLGRFRTEELARITEADSGTRTYGQNSKVHTRGDTYVLESIHRSRNRSKRNTQFDVDTIALRPAAGEHSDTAFAAEIGEGSLKSFGSDGMMIHRKVEYDVTTS